MVRTFKNYINGKWTASSSGEWIKDVNPADARKLICKVPKSNKHDVHHAVTAAQGAFLSWKATPPPVRAKILLKAAMILESRKKEIATLMCREMGKVLKECLGDVQEGIDIGYYMAGEGRRLFGQTMPSELKNKHIRTVREPVGVFALVTPWNFPIAIPCWKLFPALVAGNTVVFKPSSYVPASAARLVEIFEKAGVPKGVLNLLHGTGSETGNALITHPDINGVSFTGSTGVGRKIGEHCGKNLIKHSLEMGGKNVIIVMDDADIDLAVDGAIWGGFGTTGQRCTAASRVLVHQKVYHTFKGKFVSRAKKLRLGDGLKRNTDVGPLINEDQVKKSQQYIDDARKARLKILCGGKRAVRGTLKHGYFFEPTIIDNPPRTAAVSCEEIFGPVVAMIKVKNFDDAITVANNVEYGLSSAIFTSNVHLAHRAADLLETGLVYVNAATIGAEIQSPFGGVKDTGNGHREAGGIGGALETYTEMKVVNVDFSGSLQKAQGID
jgi:alpha-ketoglutaric semialdehyde dehydrogenase